MKYSLSLKFYNGKEYSTFLELLKMAGVDQNRDTIKTISFNKEEPGVMIYTEEFTNVLKTGRILSVYQTIQNERENQIQKKETNHKMENIYTIVYSGHRKIVNEIFSTQKEAEDLLRSKGYMLTANPWLGEVWSKRKWNKYLEARVYTLTANTKNANKKEQVLAFERMIRSIEKEHEC